MDAAELLRQGRPSEALETVQGQVRNDPSNARHRVLLFQLLCVLGRWDKALTQLNVAAELDPKMLLMAQVCRPAIQCEALRAEVFAGKRQPLIFGQPPEWVGWLLQANQFLTAGRFAEARDLRDKAFDAAPATAGSVNGKAFEWLADADPRLGPMLEAVIEGRYFWIPLQHIRQIRMDAPADLRDLVWTPATFLWANGGTAVGLIPTRYPGSEAAEDPAIRLARKTDWIEKDPDWQIPLGQRLLASDAGESPLLEIRQVMLGAAVETPVEAAHG